MVAIVVMVDMAIAVPVTNTVIITGLWESEF
jgi:hypothetical protein